MQHPERGSSQGLFFASIVLALGLAQVWIQLRPWAFIADDSLFYLQVARNVIRQGSSTFNSVTLTNGYHPLWLAILLPVGWLAQSAWTGVRVALILDSILMLGACLLAYRLLRKAGLRYPWIAAVVLLATLGSLGTYLSEAHLFAVMCLGFFNLLQDYLAGNITHRQAAVLGGVLALCVLTRLDAIFLAGCVFAFMLFRFRNCSIISVSLVTFLVIFLPYLGWNYLTFGHLTPISGAIHSTFPQIAGQLVTLGFTGGALLAAAYIVLPVALQLRQQVYSQFVLLGLAGASLQVVYTVLFTQGRHYHWYWTLLMICVSLGFGLLGDWLAGKRKIRKFLIGARLHPVLSALIFLFIFLGSALVMPVLRSVRQGDVNAQLMQAPQFLDRILPPNQIVAVDDSPGIIALWSNQRILPLDGLMSDYQFQDRLVEQGVERTLQHYRVCYFASVGGGIVARDLSDDPFHESGQHAIRVTSTLYDVEVGHLKLNPTQEVGRLWIGAPSLPYLIVWKLDPDCPSDNG